MNKYSKYAPTVLRIGLSLVFLWFGTQQFMNTAMWTRMIPATVVDFSGLSASTLVHFNGAFELVFGICLLLGIFTRVSTGLLALHMIHIMTVVGYGAIGVRDFGLAVAMVSLFLMGTDSVTLDAWFTKRKENSSMQ